MGQEPTRAPPIAVNRGSVGWTVFEIAADRPAFLDGLPLNGLCLEHAEDAVNAEIACQRTARKMVNLPHSSGAGHCGVNLALTTTAGLPCRQALKSRPLSGSY